MTFLVPRAVAQAPIHVPEPVKAPVTVSDLIHSSAVRWGVNETQLRGTLKCESGFNPNAIGAAGEVGAAQIMLSAHPDVTRAEALDLAYSVDWTAKQFAAHHMSWWTCWRELYSDSRKPS